jgi:hypothetical protein
MTGRWDEALERIAAMPDSYKPGAHVLGLLVALPIIHIARGDVATVVRIVERFDSYGATADIQEAAAHACARAAVLRAQSRDAEALAEAFKAIHDGMRIGMTSTVKMGFFHALEAAHATGALEDIDTLLRTLDGMSPGTVTPFLRALADHHRGRLAMVRGHDDGRASLERAIGVFGDSHIPFWQALAQLDLGACLVSQGRDDDASAVLDQAHQTLQLLGVTTYVERAATPDS